MARSTQIVNSIYAFGKRLLSYRKSEWGLNDYPVRVRAQASDPKLKPKRFTLHKYLAYIVNWHLSGTGDTREEAFRDLTTKFDTARLKAIAPMPRPGVMVPIELASSTKINVHPELAEDFIHRILEMKWAWISDESTLWDFHGDETNEAFCRKIREVYGVDISDLESAKLPEILDRIAQSTPSNS
jgi:hypothetical protein